MNALAQEGTGGVKAPAATDWARVIAVFGSATRARSSQLAAPAGNAPHASKAAGINGNKDFRLKPVISIPHFPTNVPAPFSLQDRLVELPVVLVPRGEGDTDGTWPEGAIHVDRIDVGPGLIAA